METTPFQIYPLSEKAITVQFEFETSEASLVQVMAFQEALSMKLFEGFLEMVPTYTALTIYFDPVLVVRSNLIGDSASQKVSQYLKSIHPLENPTKKAERWVRIPVCYDLEFGLDLVELSKLLNLSVEEIVQRHLKCSYTVFMVGFTPGFPYMGMTHPSIACPRKQNPRTRIPSGSVGMAGNQTGIYPLETPGGWQIIGRTPLKLFSVDSNPPALLKQGDRIKFERISKAEFDQMKTV